MPLGAVIEVRCDEPDVCGGASVGTLPSVGSLEDDLAWAG